MVKVARLQVAGFTSSRWHFTCPGKAGNPYCWAPPSSASHEFIGLSYHCVKYQDAVCFTVLAQLNWKCWQERSVITALYKTCSPICYMGFSCIVCLLYTVSAVITLTYIHYGWPFPVEATREWNRVSPADQFFLVQNCLSVGVILLMCSWLWANPGVHMGNLLMTVGVFGPYPVKIFISLNASRAAWQPVTAMRLQTASTVHMTRPRDPLTWC